VVPFHENPRKAGQSQYTSNEQHRVFSTLYSTSEIAQLVPNVVRNLVPSATQKADRRNDRLVFQKGGDESGEERIDMIPISVYT